MSGAAFDIRGKNYVLSGILAPAQNSPLARRGDNAIFRISLTASPRPGHFGAGHTQNDLTKCLFIPATGARLPMSKPPAFPALAQFVAATAGRNMTKAAYVAVANGVIMILLLTVDPAYEAAHRWVDAVLWGSLAFFIFEWVVRLRHAFMAQRGWSYAVSGRGLLDALAAIDGQEVELGLTDSNSSCLIRSPGNATARYVVMPMRL